MKKLWIYIALAMLGAGIGLFVTLCFMVDFDYSRFNNMKLVTNTYEITEEFHSLSIDTITADVDIRPAEDGKCRIICHELEKILHNVQVKDGKLEISAKDERKWTDHLFFFGSESPKVTVYLPECDFEEFKVDNTTGNITLIGSWNLQTMSLKTTTGDIAVSGTDCTQKVFVSVTTGCISTNDLNCGQLTIDGSTGEVKMTDVMANGDIQVRVTTGEIRLDRCDAAALDLKATTGDICATLLTEKQISAHSTTGEVDIPQSTAGGKCVINTTTGDIRVNIG